MSQVTVIKQRLDGSFQALLSHKKINRVTAMGNSRLNVTGADPQLLVDSAQSDLETENHNEFQM